MHHRPAPAVTLSERDSANYIGYTESALRAWRRQSRGPAYIRVGRSIRYRLVDLDAWLARHRVPTRECA